MASSIDSRALGADGGGSAFDVRLRETGTRAFLVVHHRLVYERYFDGTDRQTLQTSFSLAKSFVSTLVGMPSTRGSSGASRTR
ncbi:MAG TPA: hypothetical protein VGL18_00715 [Actinomycetota bacterium]|jgi:CubicO group peptidase (beta-lactamase class C family)